MTNAIRIFLMSLVLVALVGSVQDADAQFAKRLRDRAKQHAGEKVIQKVVEKEDKAIDEAFGDAERAVTGEEAQPMGVEASAGDEAPIASEAGAKLKPGEGAWANYDFVPGERPLFVDDFANENVGNFPRRLEFIGGSMEIVEWQGQRWIRDGGNGEFYVPLPETLPERFTMEFDLTGSGNGMSIWFDGAENHWAGGPRIEIGTWFGDIRFGEDKQARGELPFNTEEKAGTVRIMVDDSYVKLFMDEKRVAQVPNADLGRSDRILMHLNGWSAEAPRMIANLRVMAGGRGLYDALSAEGRVSTQGILFDTGSDVIRPESTPTLKEIGQMLTEHPELRLRVEGHTDNVGADEANQALSQRRAEAVKTLLAASYGVDAARIEAQGLGPSKPAADNATPEGRQQNRRVELVRL